MWVWVETAPQRVMGWNQETQTEYVYYFIYRMNYPDFFEWRTQSWRFQDVVDFDHEYFVVTPHSFRMGHKTNSIEENQRACAVIAYAILMNYTFEQTKALFSEHDHFAIAIPESRKERNIYQLNKIYVELLQWWAERDIRVCDYLELIEMPEWVLKLK